MSATELKRFWLFRNMYFRLAKIAEVKSKLQGSGGFRESLKSTGQSKYAIDEKEEGVCVADCLVKYCMGKNMI